MIVTVSILALFSLGLFITTIIFYSQRQAIARRYAELEQQGQEFVQESERQRDDIRQIRDVAQRDRRSVVGYLNDSMQTVMERVTGSKRDTPETLTTRLETVPGADTGSLLDVLRDRDQQIATLDRRVAAAEEARTRALEDRENEVNRVNRLEESQRATLAAVTEELDRYKGEVDSYREGLNVAKADMDRRVGEITAEGEERAAALNAQIAENNRELVLANDTLRRLQGELRGRTFQGADEFALVDGEVVGTDPAEGHVFISRGRRDKIRLGMTFEVYAEPTALRPDPTTGEYPAGKASLEVIRIDDATATARITREKRGNPVIKGDVIANVVYDPNKVYTFLLYGNFDANRDGVTTAEERSDVAAMIQSFGGKVTESLAGNVDYLVLGEKPPLPPQPRLDAPPAVVLEYTRLRNAAQEYDRLQGQAERTSIPILNENRLYTLIGKTFSR